METILPFDTAPEVPDLRSLSREELEARTLFVTGEDIITPRQYRNRQENMWRRALDQTNLGDVDLADAVALSVMAKACSEYRANTLSSIPMKVLDDAKSDAEWHPFTWFMDHAKELLWHIATSRHVWGRAYLRKIPNAYGYPTGLQWINPLNIQPYIDPITERVDHYYLYVTGEVLQPDQVVAIVGFDPNDPNGGLSPYEMVMSRILTERNMQNFGASFFFNAARPDGILLSKSVMTDDQLERAKADWKSFRGSKNSFRTFVSSGEWEWIPVTPPPVDLTMPELKDDLRRDVCIAFQVNGVLVGAAGASDPLSAQSTFSAIQRDHVESVELPELERILTGLTNQWAATDFDEPFTLMPDRMNMSLLSDVTQERSVTVTTLTTGSLVDYNEGRHHLGLPPREDYLLRDPTQLLATWREGALTWNRLREMLGEEAVPGVEIININGQLLPVARLLEVANANVERLKAPPAPAFPSLLPPRSRRKPAPVRVDPVPEPQLPAPEVRSSEGLPEASVVMKFAPSDAFFCNLKTRLQAAIPDTDGIRWTEDGGFHITLAYSRLVGAEALEAIAQQIAFDSPVVVEVEALDVFAQGDQNVLIARVESPALRALQVEVARAFTEAGAALSEYSQPDAYQPHVTMAYLATDVPLPDLPQDVRSFFEPNPAEMTFSVAGASIEISRPGWRLVKQIAPGQSITPARAQRTLRLSVALSDHQMVRYAQRELADLLAQRDVVGVEYVLDDDYELVIATMSPVKSASAAIEMLRVLALDDMPKVLVETANVFVAGGLAVLRIAPNEDLARLQAQIDLAMLDAGFDDSRSLPMCVVLARNLPDSMEGETLLLQRSYPIVLNNICLRLDAREIYQWSMRAASPEQLKELRNWQHRVAKKGTDVPFEPIALAGSPVVDFVRSALCCADHAEAVFERARQALVRGDFEDLTITPTPADFEKYWSSFDALQLDLSQDWQAYMTQLLDPLLEAVAVDGTNADLDAVFVQQQEALIAAWTGTTEEPGPLAALAMAGMAAGNEALLDNLPAEPTRTAPDGSICVRNTDSDDITGNGCQSDPPLRALNLTIDWTLLNAQAIEFSRQYGFDLIRRLNDTTRERLNVILAQWLESGQSLDSLRQLLVPLFQDERRAQLIAQSESIIIYNEGAFARWQDVGVTRAQWVTVNDGLVCPICQSLNGTVANISEGWDAPEEAGARAGTKLRANAHPGCRCFRRPIL